MIENQMASLLPSRREMMRAFHDKDTAYDGLFFVAVRTTGIFCRPSCLSRPKAANVEFFGSIKDCLAAGYRPCKRCHPLETDGTPPPWAAQLMERVESSPDVRIKAADLREMGVTPERARLWFKQHYGMTFAGWCRGHRLAGALNQIRNGAKLDDVIFDSGFESHSGFRDAFQRTFKNAPGRARNDGARLVTAMIESPLGPLLAAASEEGICLLEFTDRRMLERNLAEIRKQLRRPVVPGDDKFLTQLKQELVEYFAGKRREFTVRVSLNGTPFQEKAWRELQLIPFGETISYEEQARRIGQPTARRAVARANGMNRICILVPCHRVIGKDGTLTGYGGGLWRKKWLLELERAKSQSQRQLNLPTATERVVSIPA